MKVDFSKVIELSHDMIPSAPTADVKPFDHSPEAAPFDPDHTKEEHFRLMAQTYDVSVMGAKPLAISNAKRSGIQSRVESHIQKEAGIFPEKYFSGHIAELMLSFRTIIEKTDFRHRIIQLRI